MKFPLIYEIATKDVVNIDINQTLAEAIDMMYKYNHRNIIVIDKNRFFILTANDILKLKLKSCDFSNKISSIDLEVLPTINKDENILDTMSFLERDIEYICATDDEGNLFGLVTYTDIISHIDPESLMENYRLADLMKMNKNVQKISKDSSTKDALEGMAENNYDCVVVLEGKLPIGILTTKDIMNLIKNRPNLDSDVSEYMSTPVESLDENSSIKEAINFMQVKHFKRIVTTNSDGEFTGLILQKELISLSYSRWAILMKQYSSELSEINTLLEDKSKKFEKMASIDQLTGLYNRYKFTELFVLEYHTMVQRDNKMSLIMLDIDHFKKINDRYGHNIGDTVLLQLSNILLRHLRNVDIIGRWGGEEFLILLPTAEIENAKKLAEKLRLSIEEYDMDNNLKITTSFGVTEIKQGDDIKSAVKRADDALYEAKAKGRNCVVVNTQ
ncbi:MAG: diguanylate cyclase [Helicobacteraceae bacterium]|nr:diguanylate cyclase [Helicobacteraceae bacterium]